MSSAHPNKATLLQSQQQHLQDCQDQKQELLRSFPDDHILIVAIQEKIDLLEIKVTDLAQARSAGALQNELNAIEKKKASTKKEHQEMQDHLQKIISAFEEQLAEEKRLASQMQSEYADTLAEIEGDRMAIKEQIGTIQPLGTSQATKTPQVPVGVTLTPASLEAMVANVVKALSAECPKENIASVIADQIHATFPSIIPSTPSSSTSPHHHGRQPLPTPPPNGVIRKGGGLSSSGEPSASRLRTQDTNG